jgi:DNA-binding beta-propeller fold protein YncE
MTVLQVSRRIGCTLSTALLAVLSSLAADSPALESFKTIKLSGPAGKRLDHMALDAKRDRLFVANSANNSLDVVDLKQYKVLKSIPNQDGVQGVAYAPDHDRVVAALGNGICNVFDGESFKLLKSHKIPSADNPTLDSRGALVYLTAADKKLSIVDAKTGEMKGDVNLPTAPASFAFEKGRSRMYVNAHIPRQVLVLDSTKHEVLKRYQLDEAGNYPLALDEANKRLFVGCRMEPRLVVLDTETGKQLASLPIPHDVDDIYVDAKRKQVYASCGEGFLVAVKEAAPNKFEVIQKVPTVKMARSSLFDPASSQLFVSVPGQGKEGPEVRVYRVK